jgi:hypothetical protein
MRQHTAAYVSIRQHTAAYVSIRQHSSAYVSIRQHTPAYVSMRQNMSSKRRTSATTLEKTRKQSRRFQLDCIKARGWCARSLTLNSKAKTLPKT